MYCCDAKGYVPCVDACLSNTHTQEAQDLCALAYRNAAQCAVVDERYDKKKGLGERSRGEERGEG